MLDIGTKYVTYWYRFLRAVRNWYQFFTVSNLRSVKFAVRHSHHKKGPNTKPPHTPGAKINYESTTTESPPYIERNAVAATMGLTLI